MHSSSVGKSEWTKTLRSFSDRNAGRRTWLEIDDPRFGVHEQEHEYQLLGVVYDRKDDRVQIMLGTFGGIGPHLTHTIGDVDEIDVLTDEAGRDLVLRIGQGQAQTLLRVERFLDDPSASPRPRRLNGS